MRWRRGQLALAAVMAAGLATGCKEKPTNAGPPDAGPPVVVNPPADAGNNTEPDAGQVVTITPVVDLRADVNRDGVVSLTDDSDVAGKTAWNEQRGAIFLANIDDDTKRCEFNNQISDIDLAKCNDAADTIVNGDDDLLDLAYLKTVPWPEARDDVYGQLFVDDKALPQVRLFKKIGGNFVEYPAEEPLLAPELREGVEFAIEARDIVRDPAVWDGFVDLRLEVNYKDENDVRQKASDTVRMRVSPVMTFHHLDPAETVYVTNITASWGVQDSLKFQNELTTAITAAGVPNPLYKYSANDQWIQDHFEPGYMSMPKAGGGQHVIRVNYRSANVYAPNNQGNPLRPAGRIVYALRGKDVAAVQEFMRNHNGSMDTLDSTGNTETIPPFSLNGVHYPLGRSFRGSTSTYFTDPNFTKMMEAQKIQPPVYVDTSWLLVGHVDETVSFLKANTPRGWVLLANDPIMAKQMLEAEVAKGNGDVQMFVGKQTYNAAGTAMVSATRTINQVLADTEVMNESAISAVKVDGHVAKITEETGIEASDIIRVPFLHEPISGLSVAYQPGTVNLLALNDTTVAMPDPFGPVIDGKDIFKEQLQTALAAIGYTIHWIDDWRLYHILLGEVHCATNTARSIPSVKWWETGR
jgi:protein-arginine deiminase